MTAVRRQTSRPEARGTTPGRAGFRRASARRPPRPSHLASPTPDPAPEPDDASTVGWYPTGPAGQPMAGPFATPSASPRRGIGRLSRSASAKPTGSAGRTRTWGNSRGALMNVLLFGVGPLALVGIIVAAFVLVAPGKGAPPASVSRPARRLARRSPRPAPQPARLARRRRRLRQPGLAHQPGPGRAQLHHLLRRCRARYQQAGREQRLRLVLHVAVGSHQHHRRLRRRLSRRRRGLPLRGLRRPLLLAMPELSPQAGCDSLAVPRLVDLARFVDVGIVVRVRATLRFGV